MKTGLTGRAYTVIKAKVSALLDRAENPNETLDYSYQRQLEHLQKVKRGIADVTTAKKRLQMQAHTLAEQADKLDVQAREALSHGREDLSRVALEQKALGQSELETLGRHIEELERRLTKRWLDHGFDLAYAKNWIASNDLPNIMEVINNSTSASHTI